MTKQKKFADLFSIPADEQTVRTLYGDDFIDHIEAQLEQDIKKIKKTKSKPTVVRELIKIDNIKCLITMTLEKDGLYQMTDVVDTATDEFPQFKDTLEAQMELYNYFTKFNLDRLGLEELIDDRE